MHVSRLLGVVLAVGFSTGVAFAFAQSAAKKSAESSGSVASQLMANEHKVLDALKSKDAAGFSSLVVTDSWNIDENGLMKTAEFVKALPELKVESLKTSDMKVLSMSPTVSLVTYKLDQKGSFLGQAFPPVVYATTVWVNNGDTWRAMFHQESTAAPARK
ncbi:MAG: hypothetical protein ABJA98_19715 [Acidobacteriota bacterium]